MADIYQRMIESLSRAKRVLVTTHVRPDGDAIGTAAAMVLGLAKVGIPAEVLLLTHLPSKYAFLFEENGIRHYDAEKAWPADLDLSRFDTLLVVDTGTWSQLPGVREKLEGWDGRRLVLDHHQTQEDWADVKLVVRDAAAAGEIAAELLEQWEISLDKKLAEALYVAVITDTGWFQFANTRPYTLRLCAMLMEAGVDTDRIYQLLYQNERPQRVLLQTRAMQSLELLGEGKLAVMTIGREDFARTGAGVPDTENLINIPLQIRTVAVSMLVTEPPEGGPVRVSLRSKGQVDLAAFAERFGGGGHARAAGLKLPGDLPAVRGRIAGELLKNLGAAS